MFAGFAAAPKARGREYARPAPASSLANSRRVKPRVRLWLRIGTLVSVGFLLKRFRQLRSRSKGAVGLGGSPHFLEDRSQQVVQTPFLVGISALQCGGEIFPGLVERAGLSAGLSQFDAHRYILRITRHNIPQ